MLGVFHFTTRLGFEGTEHVLFCIHILKQIFKTKKFNCIDGTSRMCDKCLKTDVKASL